MEPNRLRTRLVPAVLAVVAVAAVCFAFAIAFTAIAGPPPTADGSSPSTVIDIRYVSAP